MNKLRMLLSEAIRSIFMSASTTVAATVTVLIGMFVLGLSIALGSWVLSWSDHVKSTIHVKVYMCTTISCDREATPAQLVAVRKRLNAMPEVKSVDFISKRQALNIMRKRTPELTEGLSSNPLPASFEVVPVRAEFAQTIKDRLTPPPPGVEKAKDGGATAKRILHVGKIVEIVFLVAVAVLLAASTLLIANTIRLSIFARRREIEVMKLVGATNWFVRGPFMVEGLICGLAGSLVAVILLLLGKEIALPALLGRVDASSDAKALAFELNALILLGTGLLLGAMGSGLTLRRFLRV